jgi:hypothetical protein
MTGMLRAKNPVTLHKDYLQEEADRRSYNRGPDIGEGRGQESEYESVGRAALAVLHAAMSGGGTTVNELTNDLADYFYIDLRSRDERIMREGLEAVIREALRMAWRGALRSTEAPMPEYPVVVERVVTLAVKAPSETAAKEAALASAWTWTPENAAGGDQGSVNVVVGGDG